MDNGKMGVGVIGTGFSADFHIQALLRLPGVKVVAVAGSSEAKARALADKYGIPAAYGSYGDLIADEAVEAVHNCTPNVLHFAVNRDVLLAGKHLLSEKPLAMNSAQSAELARLAENSKGVSGVCFNYRHFPMVVQARSMLRSGEIGKAHLVHGGYFQDWLLYDTDYSWRLEPGVNGESRAIADIGSHWCDTVQFVLSSRISEVFADLSTVHPVRYKPKRAAATFGQTDAGDREAFEVETEDAGSVLLRFQDGTRGVFTVSQVSAGRKNRLLFEIAAAESSLCWDQENPNRLWEGKRSEPNRERMRDPGLLSPEAARLAHFPGGHEEGWPDALRNLMADFYREAMSKREAGEAYCPGPASFATLADGHGIMKLIDAILESRRTGAWVRVDD